MQKVFLGIGGNLGNKPENFMHAYRLIESELGKILESSSIYETPPWGFQAEESFWNQVIIIETLHSPEKLLVEIHEIENTFGKRIKKENYSSREMDIDILYFDNIFLETSELIIPHHLMHKRKFVLVPLAEIAPDFKHPLLRINSLQMLENCKDESIIKRVSI